MGKNRTTPKRAMRYWCVGWYPMECVIRARTARVAVRKWLRENAVTATVIGGCELDNPGSSGEMPGEVILAKRRPGVVDSAKREARTTPVKSVPVCEVSKQPNRSNAPDRGAFWSGFNKR